MDILFEGIPDKRNYKNTTSLKFKKDLLDYFEKDFKDKICVEIGTDWGYTTIFLAHLFKKVYTIDNCPDNMIKAKEVTKDFNNIEFLFLDAYRDNWNIPEDKVDVVFIDCVHDYEHVSMDINNSLKYNPDYLIFDDYGLEPKVKYAVDDAITGNLLSKEVIFIGEPVGSDCRKGKILQDTEGVLVKTIKHWWDK